MKGDRGEVKGDRGEVMGRRGEGRGRRGGGEGKEGWKGEEGRGGRSGVCTCTCNLYNLLSILCAMHWEGKPMVCLPICTIKNSL